MLSGFGGCDVASYVPQAERTAESTDHKQATTTELINEEDEVDDGEDCLDDAEETGCEERGVGSSDSDGFEYCWGIVVDGINSEECQCAVHYWKGAKFLPRSILPQEQ